MAKDILSVTEINEYISGMFSTDYVLKNIRIKGEISNITFHTSGHVYFTIKDDKSTMAGVMFKGNRALGLTFPIKTGDSVVVSGYVGVYSAAGKYQIYAKSFEKSGIGELYLKFEQLKQQFEEMGMFEETYKRKIPVYASRIGIVTASTGAAIHDIITTATRRNPHIQLLLYPSLVQGDGAAHSIALGIETLDSMNLDVIIVGRGGGSIEDLWAFNEEEVARAIFACNTPVISAVGHEVDVTIADYVADVRAATPTAAAEIAVFEYDAFLDDIYNLDKRLNYALDAALSRDRNRYNIYKNRLGSLSPTNVLAQYKLRLIDISNRLDDKIKLSVVNAKHNLSDYAGRLDGLSPAKRLSEGYSVIVDDKGDTITQASQLEVGDLLKIYLSKGSAQAEVLKINN